MVKKLDPRVRRTRQALRDAMIALILDKGYDEITIQDITERAQLRRATFYLHYADKHELLLAMLREIADDLRAKIDHLSLKPLSAEAEYATFLIIFNHARQHANLYRAIINGPGSMVAVRYLREYIIQTVQDKFRAEVPPTDLAGLPLEIVATYLATFKLYVVIWWLENHMPYPPEVIARICTQLSLRGLSGEPLPLPAKIELAPLVDL